MAPRARPHHDVDVGPRARDGCVLCVGAQLAVLHATAATLIAKQEAPAVPEDWVCSRAGWIKNGRQTNADACHCHAIASKATSCEERVEEKSCNRYCRADKCSCPSAECK